MSDTQERRVCGVCGEPMPEGEEMFKYHGYSGPCPKPPLPKADAERPVSELVKELRERRAVLPKDCIEGWLHDKSINALQASEEREQQLRAHLQRSADKLQSAVNAGMLQNERGMKALKVGQEERGSESGFYAGVEYAARYILHNSDERNEFAVTRNDSTQAGERNGE